MMAQIIVFSGPSGAGKGELIKALKEWLQDKAVRFPVSATTRLPREGEVNGQHYHFLSPEDFQGRVDNGGFLEFQEVHGHRYGTLWSEITNPITEGYHVILEIEPKGFQALRSRQNEIATSCRGIDVHGIFIHPPSPDELRRRIEKRGGLTAEQIVRRVQDAEEQIQMASWYTHYIINGCLEQAITEAKEIISGICLDLALR